MPCKPTQRVMAGFLLLSVLLLGAAAELPAMEKININTATAEQLEALPGIGPALAGQIVEHRAQAPFASPEEIMTVKGIGNAKFAKIKEFIKVE